MKTSTKENGAGAIAPAPFNPDSPAVAAADASMIQNRRRPLNLRDRIAILRTGPVGRWFLRVTSALVVVVVLGPTAALLSHLRQPHPSAPPATQCPPAPAARAAECSFTGNCRCN